jgi:hypothetical protein
MATGMWIGNRWNSRYLNRRAEKLPAYACTKEAESKEQADDVQSRFSGLWINASDKKEGIPCEQEEPSHIRCL